MPSRLGRLRLVLDVLLGVVSFCGFGCPACAPCIDACFCCDDQKAPGMPLRLKQNGTCYDQAAAAHGSWHITGVYVPPPLSPGVTKDGKDQEGQCVIGCGGARHQRLQRATATVSWWRAQARHITGVYVLPQLAPLRMSERSTT